MSVLNRRLKALWHTFCSVPPFNLMGNTVHQAQHSWESLSTVFSVIVVCWSLSSVYLFTIPWPAACQASLPFTISQSLLKLMSIKSVMPSNHLILWREGTKEGERERDGLIGLCSPPRLVRTPVLLDSGPSPMT